MRALLLGGLLALAACVTADQTKVKSDPVMQTAGTGFSSGPRTVSGGEVIALRGATVTVQRVVYVNSPCPEGAQCIHSGVIKQVQFKVVHNAEADVVVNADTTKVEDAVELKVHAVREGPQADIEVSLPVSPGNGM